MGARTEAAGAVSAGEDAGASREAEAGSGEGGGEVGAGEAAGEGEGAEIGSAKSVVAGGEGEEGCERGETESCDGGHDGRVAG